MPPSASFVAALAQEDPSVSVFFWSLPLIGLVIALFVITTFVRKRLAREDDVHGEGFTLSDLRRMHQKGQMTDQEFERARAALLGSLKNLPPRPTDTLHPKEPPPTP